MMNEASTNYSVLKSIFRSSNKPQNNSGFVVLFLLGEEEAFPMHVLFSFFSFPLSTRSH